MAKKVSSGKGNRKAGRKRNRPCQKMYTFERRWEVNKRKKAQKTANKFGHIVKIKVNGEWEIVKPV